MRTSASVVFVLVSLIGITGPGASARAGPVEPVEGDVARGRTLFQRSWKPQDIHCHNGDGLGPVYNETSCVACHNLGGSGGAGSRHKNAEIMTPFLLNSNNPLTSAHLESLRFQTGLRSMTSSVLHKFGTSPGYRDWRVWLLSKLSFEDITLRHAERNTPGALRAGLIDAIPDTVLEARETMVFPEFPPIRGRVSRFKDGTIGRFGWKGQTATLDDFVRTACSAELGLEVPGHHQSPDPSIPKDKPSELDLTDDDCRAMVAYVASLPAPVMIEPPDREGKNRWSAGGALFKSIGCATCHTPTLGDVTGLYSDLLLHDLGPANSGDGYYTSGEANPLPPSLALARNEAVQAGNVRPQVFGAFSPEWRTTPLWGLRDSAPYMHDGKARTIEEAIGRHGGQAEAVRLKFDALSGVQKIQLRKFLLSLAAPPDAEHLPTTPIRTHVPRSSAKAPTPSRTFRLSSHGSTGAF